MDGIPVSTALGAAMNAYILGAAGTGGDFIGQEAPDDHRADQIEAADNVLYLEDHPGFSRRIVEFIPNLLHNYNIKETPSAPTDQFSNSSKATSELNSSAPDTGGEANTQSHFTFEQQELLRAVISEIAGGATAQQVIDRLQQQAEPALPPIPTEKYVGNRGGGKDGENIVEFLRRVWMPWIEIGALTRPELRRFDPKADAAIVNWRRTREWPAELNIPSRADVTERRAARAGNDPLFDETRRARHALEARKSYAKRR